MAAAALLAWPAQAEEVRKSADGGCVVSFGDERPTLSQLRNVFEVGPSCLEEEDLERIAEKIDRGLGIRRVCPQGSALALSVQFEFDSAALTAEAQSRLRDVATVIREHATCDFLLEGHTDAAGDEGYNLGLSDRRARAVADYLASLDVDPRHLTAVGRGEASPLVPEDPYAGANRRVEVAITGDAQTAQR